MALFLQESFDLDLDLSPPRLLLFGAAIVVLVLFLFAARWLLARMEEKHAATRFGSQAVLFGLTLLGLIGLVLVLPVERDLRGQVLVLLGILLSAAIALASTTLLGNILAGLMLRAIRGFDIGDFVRCEGHFGRVTERGLFHTEIQTEDRDLTTLTNLFLATHPVNVIRASGTIVSASVSLGYDAPRRRVKELLQEAAHEAKLEEPFVRITDLGDYSVEYRVGGLLREVKEVLSAGTRLRGAMLDSLHAGGIEIVSPTVLSTRRIDSPVIPPVSAATSSDSADPEHGPALEDLAFDKAELTASVADLQARAKDLQAEALELQKRAATSGDPEEGRALEAELALNRARLERVEKFIAAREADLSAKESSA